MLGGPLHATAEQRVLRAARFSSEAAHATSRFAPPQKTVAHPASFVGYSKSKREALMEAARARLAAGDGLDEAQRAALRSLGVDDGELLVRKKKKKSTRDIKPAGVVAAKAPAKRKPSAEDASVGGAAKRRADDAAPAAAPALNPAERRLLASLSSF